MLMNTLQNFFTDIINGFIEGFKSSRRKFLRLPPEDIIESEKLEKTGKKSLLEEWF